MAPKQKGKCRNINVQLLVLILHYIVYSGEWMKGTQNVSYCSRYSFVHLNYQEIRFLNLRKQKKNIGSQRSIPVIFMAWEARAVRRLPSPLQQHSLPPPHLTFQCGADRLCLVTETSLHSCREHPAFPVLALAFHPFLALFFSTLFSINVFISSLLAFPVGILSALKK